MSIPGTTGTTPATSKPANGAKTRKTPERTPRSGVEAATSKVMRLIGRLTEGEQRKVMAAVTALVSKAD